MENGNSPVDTVCCVCRAVFSFVNMSQVTASGYLTGIVMANYLIHIIPLILSYLLNIQ